MADFQKTGLRDCESLPVPSISKETRSQQDEMKDFTQGMPCHSQAAGKVSGPGMTWPNPSGAVPGGARISPCFVCRVQLGARAAPEAEGLED